MAMGSASEPYVHSNIANWSVGGYESLPTFVEKNNVNDAINTLTAIRGQLLDEANDFLAGNTADFMNYCVDNEYQMYAQIAVQLLQDPDAIAALMLGDTSLQMSQKDIEKLLDKLSDKLKKQIKDFINYDEIETIGARRLAIEIADGISDAEMVLVVNGGTFIRDLYKGAIGQTENTGLDNKVLKEITGVAVNQLSSGRSSGKIIDAIEAIIKKTGLHQKDNKQQQEITDSISSFMNWFRDLFLAKAKDVVKFYELSQSPEDYLDEFEKKIREKIKKNFKDIYNTVGALGDEFYVSAYQADAQTAVLEIVMESIGTVHEENVEDLYGDTFQGVKTMLTHHSLSKQSQTDILIKNSAGKVVRVQAKNASLRNAEFSNDGLINLNAHIQRDRDLISLLESLKVPNIEEIADVVVNSLWFSTHDSVTGVRSNGRLKITNGEADLGILSSLENELSIYFSTQAENFLGITLDKAADTEAQILAGASNIFFLKNGRLIPTYTLVDEVIADLEHYRDDGLTALQGIHFKINKPGSTAWKYPSDTKFWVEKAKDDFANRLAIGTSQGSGAISSIKVHGTFPKVHELTSLVVNTD